MTAEKKKELVVRLPADLHAEVVARSVEEERTVSGTIRIALRQYLARFPEGT